MPPLETLDRYEDAVYWPKDGEDQDGSTLIGDAVQLKVRWNWTRRELRMPDNQTVLIEAEVITDRDLIINSIIWQGHEDDLPPGTSWAGEGHELFEVVSGERTRDLKGIAAHTFRSYNLIRHKGALPESAP